MSGKRPKPPPGADDGGAARGNGKTANGSALNDDDLGLWRQVTESLKPLPGRSPPVAADKPSAPPRPGTKASSATVHRAPKAVEAKSKAKPLTPGTLHDIDKRTADRLKRGKLPVEARLDLHGRTQVQAERALARFLADAQAAGLRNVLLITGKGGPGGGVLRREVPRWLNQPPNRDRVVAITPAQPKDGGEGAFYLRIKRLRERG